MRTHIAAFACLLVCCSKPADPPAIEAPRDDLGTTPCCARALEHDRARGRAHGHEDVCLEGSHPWCDDRGRGDGLCTILCVRDEVDREQVFAARYYRAASAGHGVIHPPAPTLVAAAAHDALRHAGMGAPILEVPRVECYTGFSGGLECEPAAWPCASERHLRHSRVRRFYAVDPVTRTNAYACCEVGSETCSVPARPWPCDNDDRDCEAPPPIWEQPD